MESLIQIKEGEGNPWKIKVSLLIDFLITD